MGSHFQETSVNVTVYCNYTVYTTQYCSANKINTHGKYIVHVHDNINCLIPQRSNIEHLFKRLLCWETTFKKRSFKTKNKFKF